MRGKEEERKRGGHRRRYKKMVFFKFLPSTLPLPFSMGEKKARGGKDKVNPTSHTHTHTHHILSSHHSIPHPIPYPNFQSQFSL